MGTVLIDTFSECQRGRFRRLAFPYGERKQPEGLTEEVFGYRFAEKRSKCGEPLPTSLRLATLPKGEGKESPNINSPLGFQKPKYSVIF